MSTCMPTQRTGKRASCSIAYSLLLAVFAPVGCTSGDSTEELVLRCATLEGAKQSADQELGQEIERLEQLEQTPLTMVRVMPDPEENAAAILADLLGDEARLRLFPKFHALMPADRFEFGQPQLQQVRDAIRGALFYRTQLDRAEAAPLCQFDVRYDLGFFGRMRFLDDVAIATRLHLLTAAPLLADGDLAAACDELELALDWVDRLAKVRRIESRLLATQLRGECLLVVEAIAGANPRFTRSPTQQADIERLYALLLRSLDDWPDDAGPLVGDRAVAMHSYEAVRAGLFDMLVTDEEKALLKRQGKLEQIASLSGPELDRDERKYLQVMATLIEASSRPYYESASEVGALLRGLDPQGQTESADIAAPLATHLFLPGLDQAIRDIGRDRAIVEAWAIALAAAGELDMPPFRTNPVTGIDYQIERVEGGLYVRIGDPELRDAFARTLR